MNPIKIYTARFGYRRGNSGDECSRYIIRTILPDREILVEPDPARANLFAVGSVLDQMQPGEGRRVAVCGTGLIDEYHRSHLSAENVGLFALRGPLTASRTRIGGLRVESDLPYGDLGILINGAWPQHAFETPTRYRLGIVAHYVDMDDDELCVLVRHRGEDVTVIDPCAPVRDVLRGIAECEAVLSSSLHGLVFAESLGIPSQWFMISDKLAGGSFKFRDWYAGLNQETDPLPLSMAEAHGMPVDEMVSMCSLRPRDALEAMQVRLREALVRAVEWLDEEPPIPEPDPVHSPCDTGTDCVFCFPEEDPDESDSPVESP